MSDQSSNNTWRLSVKVGDLVMCNGHVALVIVANAHETLIKWADDGIVEDADNYTIGLEVVSES